tara:strand:- start:9644 stop:9940 length:297 start_codon:yes stop_codon:yes gene_type:complete
MTVQPRVSETVSQLITSFETVSIDDQLRKLLSEQLARLSGELAEASTLMKVASAQDIAKMSQKVATFLRVFDQTVAAISKLGFHRKLDKDIAKHKSKQ